MTLVLKANCSCAADPGGINQPQVAITSLKAMREVEYGSPILLTLSLKNLSGSTTPVTLQTSLEDHSNLTGGAPLGTRAVLVQQVTNKFSIEPDKTAIVPVTLGEQSGPRVGDYLVILRVLGQDNSLLAQKRTPVRVRGLPVKIELPSTVFAGETISASVVITNCLSRSVSNLTVRVELPYGCKPSEVQTNFNVAPRTQAGASFAFSCTRAGPQTVTVNLAHPEVGFWQASALTVVGRRGPFDIRLTAPTVASVGETLEIKAVIKAVIRPRELVSPQHVTCELVLPAGWTPLDDLDRRFELGKPAEAVEVSWRVRANQPGVMPLRIRAGEALQNSSLSGVIVTVRDAKKSALTD